MERRLHFIFYFIAYVEPYLFKRYTILWSGFIYGNYVDLKLKNVSMHIYTYILVQPQYSACNWLLESIELKTKDRPQKFGAQKIEQEQQQFVGAQCISK